MDIEALVGRPRTGLITEGRDSSPRGDSAASGGGRQRGLAA